MEATATPQPLRFARHIVGMMILALASPYIWYGSQRTLTWASTWIAPLLIAGVAFGLYALFFTKRAKAAWPRSFFMLAWVLLVLGVASPYLEKISQKQAAQQIPAQQAPASDDEWWKKGSTLVGGPPSFEEAEHWTQESTNSTDIGPWLQYALPGSRFCRLADKTIVTVYPPGVKPQAEKANPFCATGSVSSPAQL